MSNVVYLSKPDSSEFIKSPDSLAYQAIVLKKPTYNIFLKEYADGLTIKQMDFGIDFAKSCARYTVEELKKSEDPEHDLPYIMEIFSLAICHLRDIEFSEGLIELRYEIIKNIPQFCVMFEHTTKINMLISHEIALLVLENVYDQQTKHDIVVNTLLLK